VGGHLLPERAAWVRAHVGVALLADAEDRVQALRRALGSRARLVVIDGADVLDAAERDQAAALLHDSAEALRAASDSDARLTLVVTARSESAVLALLADAHRADVSSLALRPGTTQTTTTAEVTA
jgi:RND superfamily putative drug exporter